MPSAPAKPYNGGAVTSVAGNNTIAINIAATAFGVPGTSGNGVYRISRATVTGGTVGAYAVVGTVPAVYQSAAGNTLYGGAAYNDNAVVNGTTYSHTVALDNNA